MASVGSKDNSHDNAMAEAFNCLFEAELVGRRRMKSVDEFDTAVTEDIGWFSFRRAP